MMDAFYSSDSVMLAESNVAGLSPPRQIGSSDAKWPEIAPHFVNNGQAWFERGAGGEFLSCTT